jgi:hypothetical protein
MFEISGIECDVIKKPLKGGLINSTLIIPKSTTKALRNKSKGKAELLDYDDVKEFVEQHRKQLMPSKTKKYQINVFTMQGWRAGKRYMMNDGRIDWYDAKKQYQDKVIDDDEIFGIQILEWGF